MNNPFTPQALSDIRTNISKALTDTFQMMFRMDALTAPPMKMTGGGIICSYITMENKDTKACLSVAISKTVVEHICDGLKPGESPHPQALIQDIVNEITNIVSNHLRSYMADKLGVEFELSLPKPGTPPADKAGKSAINLHFRMREDDRIALDFGYAA